MRLKKTITTLKDIDRDRIDEWFAILPVTIKYYKDNIYVKETRWLERIKVKQRYEDVGYDFVWVNKSFID